MGKGRNRRKNRIISIKELIVRFPFLQNWEYNNVVTLHNALKRKDISKERLQRVPQQEIDNMKSRNVILATLDNNTVRGYIISLRFSLLDRFDQESREKTKKSMIISMRKAGYPGPTIYHVLKNL